MLANLVYMLDQLEIFESGRPCVRVLRFGRMGELLKSSMPSPSRVRTLDDTQQASSHLEAGDRPYERWGNKAAPTG
jgi:hypothetical protein